MAIYREDGSYDFRATDAANRARANSSWNSIGGWMMTFLFGSISLVLLLEYSAALGTAGLTFIGLKSHADCLRSHPIVSDNLQGLCGEEPAAEKALRERGISGGR